MPLKSETLFRKKVDVELKKLPNSWFESIQQKSISGTPDKLGCVSGVFVALELKAEDGGQPTPLQAYKLDRINQSGGYARCVHPGNFKQIMAELWFMAKKGSK